MRTLPIALLCLVARPRCGSPAPRTVPSQPWGSLADGLRLRPRASTDRSPAGACHGQRAAHSPSLHRPCRAHKAALSLKVIERLRRLGLGQTQQLPHEHCVGSDVRRQTSRERRARRRGQVSGWAFLPSSAVLADAASGTRWCAHSRGTARGTYARRRRKLRTLTLSRCAARCSDPACAMAGRAALTRRGVCRDP